MATSRPHPTLSPSQIMVQNALSASHKLQRTPKTCRKPAPPPPVIFPWPPTQYHCIAEITHYPAAGGVLFRRLTGKLELTEIEYKWYLMWNPGPERTYAICRWMEYYNVWAIQLAAFHLNKHIGNLWEPALAIPDDKPFDTGPMTHHDDARHTYFFLRITE